MGLNVSAVTGRALSKGSSNFFTQLFIFPLYSFWKLIMLPSGDNWPPAISGLSKKSSRSIRGGSFVVCFFWARDPTQKASTINNVRKGFRIIRLILSMSNVHKPRFVFNQRDLSFSTDSAPVSNVCRQVRWLLCLLRYV